MSTPGEQQIRERLAAIDADERYHYPAANVDVNAPLALIQVSMQAEAAALAWVLGEQPPAFGPKKREPATALPFKVSADYIEWAHGPGAESGQPLARELCALPVKGKQVHVPADRLDLLKEVRSVAYLYVGGPAGDNDPRAARVLNRLRTYLRDLGE